MAGRAAYLLERRVPPCGSQGELQLGRQAGAGREPPDAVALDHEAKEKHAQGIQLLVRDFSYHPLFKRWDDNFTSVPFKPA